MYTLSLFAFLARKICKLGCLFSCSCSCLTLIETGDKVMATLSEPSGQQKDACRCVLVLLVWEGGVPEALNGMYCWKNAAITKSTRFVVVTFKVRNVNCAFQKLQPPLRYHKFASGCKNNQPTATLMKSHLLFSAPPSECRCVFRGITRYWNKNPADHYPLSTWATETSFHWMRQRA